MREVIKSRWNVTFHDENMILNHPAKGQINKRADYRGVKWERDRINKRFLKPRSTVCDIDLSYSHIDQWSARNITLNNILADSAYLPSLYISNSTLNNCTFVKCDLGEAKNKTFLSSKLKNCVIESCVGNNKWLTGVKKIDSSKFINLEIDEVGDADPISSPEIENSYFSGVLSRWCLPQGRGKQQFKNCDIREAELNDVTFPGVNFDDVLYPESLNLYVVKDWEKCAFRVESVAKEACRNTDKNTAIAGQILMRILKNEREASYWIKDRWSRGSRFTHEIYPKNGLKAAVTRGIAELYNSVGLIEDNHPALKL